MPLHTQRKCKTLGTTGQWPERKDAQLLLLKKRTTPVFLLVSFLAQRQWMGVSEHRGGTSPGLLSPKFCTQGEAMLEPCANSVWVSHVGSRDVLSAVASQDAHRCEAGMEIRTRAWNWALWSRRPASQVPSSLLCQTPAPVVYFCWKSPSRGQLCVAYTFMCRITAQKRECESKGR